MDSSAEDEHLEVKEAKSRFDIVDLLRYCVALANERGGRLIFGVTDKRPHRVVGTQAFLDVGIISARLVEEFDLRIEVKP